jgi:DNA-binding HxlR family transcriptional regulator
MIKYAPNGKYCGRVTKRYHCPVELAVDVVGGTWRPVILSHLKEGAHRYGELRRRMPGITEKMLVQRVEQSARPAHVEYHLTAEGESLAPVLQALYDWGVGRATRTGTPIEPP